MSRTIPFIYVWSMTRGGPAVGNENVQSSNYVKNSKDRSGIGKAILGVLRIDLHVTPSDVI